MSNEVMSLESPVPFGKYKDQPVAVMMGDQQYVNWCLMQTWFGERYAALAAILQGRNALEQDACTPEHNSLQMLFLKPEYQTGLRRALYPDSNKYLVRATRLAEIIEDSERYSVNSTYIEACRQALKTLADCCHQPVAANNVDISIEFEANNWDVLIEDIVFKGTCACGEALEPKQLCNNEALCIELKPSISEDYPAILRKVKSRMGYLTEAWTPEKHRHKVDIGRKIVITREITAATATVGEIKAMFKMSGVELFLLSEIEALAA